MAVEGKYIRGYGLPDYDSLVDNDLEDALIKVLGGAV